MSTTQTLPAPPAALDVFVARQPILDRAGTRVAYELLYRASAAATNSSCAGADLMCNDTALHSLVSIGFERLTEGALGFVNVTREHLVRDYFRIFDPDSVVLELLETIEPDAEVLRVCEQAVKDGYTFALDDYDGRSSLDPFLPLVRIVKLDVLGKSGDQIAPVIMKLRQRGITVLAERVETMAQHALCHSLGCGLFQGYYFSVPETVDGRTLSVEAAMIMRIVALAQDPSVPDSELEAAFRSRPALSHTLLRIVSSAAVGVRSVGSIQHALQVVGRSALVRWMMVMLVGSIASRSDASREEVLRTLARARFCELAGERPEAAFRGSDPASLFLTGILSRLDVLLGLSMPDILERLPVDRTVREALLNDSGPNAPILTMAKAYESGNWDIVDAFCNQGSTGQALSDAYCESVQWAEACLDG